MIFATVSSFSSPCWAASHLKSIAPERIIATGLAMFCPAMSGAEPCDDLAMAVVAEALMDRAVPSEPETSPARSKATRATRSVASRVMTPGMIAVSGVGMNSPVPAKVLRSAYKPRRGVRALSVQSGSVCRTTSVSSGLEGRAMPRRSEIPHMPSQVSGLARCIDIRFQEFYFSAT
ncbi:hypothetical protein ACH49_07995 [Streptomyces leeuwenhoekii]|uniref:Secreted protein n=1 Tax=Streptomyces leeuwenhoekii TaxID=1437453 RepID=A0ABR5I260_STRLW|nr:hypothetical protein ACH49_07995 [Streptomyces leeuwenhoekii]